MAKGESARCGRESMESPKDLKDMMWEEYTGNGGIRTTGWNLCTRALPDPPPSPRSIPVHNKIHDGTLKCGHAPSNSVKPQRGHQRCLYASRAVLVPVVSNQDVDVLKISELGRYLDSYER